MKNYQSIKTTYQPYEYFSKYTSHEFEFGPIILFMKNGKNTKYIGGWSGNINDLLEFF